jgi:hypothetical protein
MNEFVLFQSFFTEDELAPIMETLKENNIEYRIEKFKEPLDPIIAGEIAQNKIFLKIRPNDFKKVNGVLDELILRNILHLKKIITSLLLPMMNFLKSFKNQMNGAGRIS